MISNPESSVDCFLEAKSILSMVAKVDLVLCSYGNENVAGGRDGSTILEPEDSIGCFITSEKNVKTSLISEEGLAILQLWNRKSRRWTTGSDHVVIGSMECFGGTS